MLDLAKLRDYFAFRRDASYLPELDGLRGIAILLVLLYHVKIMMLVRGLPALTNEWSWLESFLLNAYMGVDLFFVLSGFLITAHLLREPNFFQWEFLKKYFAKRFLRIVPAYYAVVFLLVFNILPFFKVHIPKIAEVVTIHLLFLQDYMGLQLLGTFWSLGVEEKFYILLPFVLIALSAIPKISLRILIALFLFLIPPAILSFMLQHQPVWYYGEKGFENAMSPFHMNLSTLVVGCLCAFLVHYREIWIKNIPDTRLFIQMCFYIGLMLSLIFLFLPQGTFGQTYLFIWRVPLFAAGAGLIMLGLVMDEKEYRFFSSGFLFFFARISYSLYLVHDIFLWPVYYFLKDWMILGLDFGALSPVSQYVLYLSIFLSLSVMGALILYYMVEKPFLLLKAKIT